MAKKTVVCVLLVLACAGLIVETGFAQNWAEDVYDGAVTPLPEWVQRKIKLGLEPYSSDFMMNAEKERKAKAILNKGSKFAWSYRVKGDTDEVYLYFIAGGRYVWCLYHIDY